MIPYSSQESIKRITEVVTVVTVTEVTVFLEGINVGIRELMDCKYVYIDYKYITNIYL